MSNGWGVVSLIATAAGAYTQYKAGKASDLISIPDEMTDEEELARQVMLEAIADLQLHL